MLPNPPYGKSSSQQQIKSNRKYPHEVPSQKHKELTNSHYELMIHDSHVHTQLSEHY